MSVSQPPSDGPAACATLFATANSAMPSGCFDGGSSVTINWNDSGISTPPNAPCNARATIIDDGRRDRARDRKRKKPRCADEQHAARGEHLHEPAGERNHDDLGHEVCGRDPRAFLETRPQRPANVGQRRVRHVHVHPRHEAAEHAAEHRDPRAQRNGFVVRGLRSLPGCGGHDPAPGAPRVSTRAITDMPGRSTRPDGGASRRIFTGTRCTIFVKLPVALSGGSSANSAPEPVRARARGHAACGPSRYRRRSRPAARHASRRAESP